MTFPMGPIPAAPPPPTDAAGQCLFCAVAWPDKCYAHDWRTKRLRELEAEVERLKTQIGERQ